MNLIKNTIAFFGFSLITLYLLASGKESWTSSNWLSIAFFLASGFLGLGIGDWFLFKGFQRIGSARALLVFSFQPLLLSIEGYLFFGQELSQKQSWAIVFMMACVWTISYEKFRENGHWEWRGIFYAIIGVILDNIGIVLSRKGFDLSPNISAFSANGLRAFASIIPFLILAKIYREQIWKTLSLLPKNQQLHALGASFFGTFLSLTCWLTALKVGHIGSLAAVGSFNPIAATIWEWILNNRRPTKYLILSLLFFLFGFFLLIY